jgi:cyclic beta-1,2-glucan synthetase
VGDGGHDRREGAGVEGQQLRRYVAEMAASPVIAVVVAVGIVVLAPDALPAAAPFLLLWMAAPGVAYWLSVPVGARVRPLIDRERAVLRRTARKTWRYFETFVTEADAWLPPDNYQEYGDAPVLARRTSPTNIGMGLLSTLAAHDLGYLSTDGLLRRLDSTLTTLEGLERYRGHFLNWYDTATLAPLHPRYVSTVDSGNLAAALIALAQGLLQLVDTPRTLTQRLAGLADTADLLAAASASSHASPNAHATVSGINRLARAIVAAARTASPEEAIEALGALHPALAHAAGKVGSPDPVDTQRDLAYWCGAVLDAMAQLTAEDVAPEASLRSLAARASALADAMRFEFLYDRRRRIFAIGYRLADADGPGRLDASFYDLLASEARLASFVAIAKGDIPQHHWFHLGRLVTNVDGRATLMSWGGTMFEYLMPQLLMRSFPGTLLDQSCRACVRRQVEYGKQRDVPWGISESAYAFTDRAGNYQYRAFGVPGLGLRRGLTSDLVIAPYATALASPLAPDRGRELRAAGPARPGRPVRLLRSHRLQPPHPGSRDGAGGHTAGRSGPAYFAHHQGMSLVALATSSADDVFVSRFHADPRVQATELLLQEHVPREAILSEPRPAESTTTAPVLPAYASRLFRSPHTTNVHTHFLSNGRYTTAVTHAGGGFSTWRDVAITRWRRDRTGDSGAHFIYLRDPWSNRVWSATYQPVCQEPDRFEATFDARQAHVPTPRRRHRDAARNHRVIGRRRGGAPPDDQEPGRADARGRGHELRGDRAGAPRGRLAHPAFGKLFIETEFDPQSAGLLFSRRPRGADESPMVGFHVLGVDGPRLGGAVEWETDRARFLGRGRSPANPIALDGRALSGTTGAVLDPIGALRERIRLARAPWCASPSPPGSRVTGPPRWRSRASTGTAAPRRAPSRWRSRTCTSRCSPWDSPTSMAMLFDRLASRVFGEDASCSSPPDLARNTLGQQHLWGYGISGDLPIVLVRVTAAASLPLVRQLLDAQEYWRVKGLRADVVILNEHPAEYLDEVQNLLSRLVQEPSWAAWLDKPGGMFLLRADGMAEADRLLSAVAAVVLPGDLADLASQLERPAPWLYAGHDVAPSAELRPPEPAPRAWKSHRS